MTGSGARSAYYPLGNGGDSLLAGKAAGKYSWPLTLSVETENGAAIPPVPMSPEAHVHNFTVSIAFARGT
jgi:hypothetical protein